MTDDRESQDRGHGGEGDGAQAGAADQRPDTAPEPLEAAPASNANPRAPTPPVTPPPAVRSGGTAIAWLALLLVIGLAAATGWFLLDAQRREAQFLERLRAVETLSGSDDKSWEQLDRSLTRQLDVEIDGLRQQLEGERRAAELERDRLRERIDNVDTGDGLERQLKDLALQQDRRLAALATRLDGLEQQLSEQRALVAEVAADDRDAWLLAEAQYLLRLANQRLVMTGDTESAEALLKSADGVLRQLDSAALRDVRAAVAADLAAVRAVPRLDLEGPYLRLEALIERAEALIVFEMPERSAAPELEAGGDWQERFEAGYRAALARLSEYVTVRRRDQPVEPLMDPQWEALVRQNLRMQLEQAQTALLSGDQKLYDATLERARGWVEQFFASDEQAARAIAAELDALAEQRVEVAMPDLSRSLQAIDEAMARRLDDSAEP